jgi:hypothetical protein
VFGRSRRPVAAPVAAVAASPLTDGAPAGADGDAPAASDVASAIEERTIPNIVSAAWELELLIAGAVTFALFQLPGSVEELRNWLSARVSGTGEYAMIMGLLYAKAIVYSLIAAFVVNLAARAYWVGLVGLHSVFPRGVRWDQLGMGPASQETYRKRIASLPAVMSRVDNFASVIFSFAFLIVVSFIFSVIALAALGGLAYAISTAFFGGTHTSTIVYTVSGVLAIGLATVGLLDKYAGPRMDPAGAPFRRLKAATRLAISASGMSILGPILLTLMSNVGRYRMMLLFYVALLVPLMLATVEFLGRAGALRGGMPRYVPYDADASGVDADHYESLRPAGALADVPTIQSDVITGPYVRLFVPYVTARHDPALAASCPGLAPMRSGRPQLRPLSARGVADGGDSSDRALACLRTMHALAIDGRPRPEVPFRFYVHPETGRNGMIAYVPTADLASGMHTIRVMPPPRAPRSRNRGPLEPHEIVFWK